MSAPPDSLIPRGDPRRPHQVEPLTPAGERCVQCDKTFPDKAWGECPGVRQYPYKEWPSGLFTVRQLKAMRTESAPHGYKAGPVRGAVYYSDARDHFLWLHDIAEAEPRPAPTPAQQARAARMLAGWKCAECGKRTRQYHAGGGLCERCEVVEWARDLLSNPVRIAILDTETTGIQGEGEIVQIAIVDGTGQILLNSLIKPVKPILEEEFDPAPDYRGRPRRTAFAVNGISNAAVADAPTFPAVHPHIVEALRGRIVAIYNKEFDWAMLQGDCDRHGLYRPEVAGWTCAMINYAQFVGDWDHYHGHYRWHKLDEAVRAFEGSDPMRVLKTNADAQAHSALGDCLRTLAVIRSLAAWQPKEA